MNSEEIRKMLENHKKWLFNETGGIRADLCGANLYRADLYEANLRGTDLRGAYLCEANLCRANLYRADLTGADLCGADLRGANLYQADLYQANLIGTENIPTYVCPLVCPEEGSFIGFKKAILFNSDIPDKSHVIVKLKILENAKRSSATTRKCRCSEAEVISITSLNGNYSLTKAFSSFNSEFIYEVGKIVTVDNFDENRWNECSTGIHFFITRDEAVNY